MVKLQSRIVLLFIIICAVGQVYSQTLSDEQIEKAYYDSYDLEKKQKYNLAIEALYPVLKAYPSGYTVNFRLGWLSYLNGNFAESLKYYTKALAIFPAAIEVYNCISLLHKARLEWSKVEEENLKVLKIDYFNVTANYWYAYALKQQHKYDLAEKVSRKMLTVYPTSTIFLFELAEVCYLVNRKDEAKTHFKSVKILDPYNKAAQEFLELLKKN